MKFLLVATKYCDKGKYSIDEKNIRELPDIVLLAKKLGFDSLNAQYMRVYEGLDMDLQSLEGEVDLTKKYIDKARDVASHIGLQFTPPQDLSCERHEISRLCNNPWDFINIWPSGEVLPCTGWFGENPIADLKTHSFTDIWNGPEYKKLKVSLETHEDLMPCYNNCQACITDKVGKDMFKKIKMTKRPTMQKQ